MKRLLKLTFALILVLVVTAIYFLYPPPARSVQWPDGKKFAFSIIDDTDGSSIERLRPLYDVLIKHGVRTTKTTWVLDGAEQSHYPNTGVSLTDAEYRNFLHHLRSEGFEIALHGVRGGSSKREDILAGLSQFNQEFGNYPDLHINHSLNKDNLYWGPQRYAITPFKWLYSHLVPWKFYGDDPDSEYFWGDAAKKHIRYVRRFTFKEINLLKINPSFPYRLESKPLVNLWFPNSDGGNLDEFEKLLQKENLDRLEREGGVTLIYSHLGMGSFSEEDNSVDPRFIARIKDLSTRNGWFAPATEILDHMKNQPDWKGELTFREKVRLDLIFLFTRYFLF